MIVINLSKNTEFQFSHNNLLMAFAYAIADKLQLQSQFVTNPDKIIKEHVAEQVREGQYGYHLVDLSIPKSSIDDTSNIVLQ